MKTNKRMRVISWLLTFAMVVGMLPLSALSASAKAREGNGTENYPYIVYDYDELQQWISAAPANAATYFKLFRDLEYTQGTTDAKKIEIDNGKQIFIDLNGRDIFVQQEKDSLPLPYIFRVTDGSTLTIDDSSPCYSNGNYVNCIDGRFLYDGMPHNLIRVEDHSSVVINGGHLYKSSTCVSATNYAQTMPNGVIAADKTSEIIINGGRIDGANYTLDTRVTENLYRRDSAIASYGKLTINGGEFRGVVGILDLPDGNDIAVTINGGTFNNCVQVDAALTATADPAPRIAIYGGNFKDRFVVNPGIKGISVETEFYIPILLRGGTFSSLITEQKKEKNSDHDCTAISLYDIHQLYGKPDLGDKAKQMNRKALAACIGDSAVYVRYCSDGYKYTSEKYGYFTRKNTGNSYMNIGHMYDDGGYVKIFSDSFGLKEVLLDNNVVEKPKNIDDGASFSSGNVPFYSVSSLGTHSLTFRWYDLPQEMKDDGYSYKVTFQTQSVSEIVVPSSSITTTVTADGTVNEWSYTIPKTHTTTQQATLRLDLMKNGEVVTNTATHNDYLLMYGVEQNTKTLIDNVNLDISAPLVEGDKTSGTVTASDNAGYTVTSQTVWQGTDEYEDLNNNEYYPANLKTNYYKSITLTAKDGFAFDSDNKPSVNISGLGSDYESCYVSVKNETTALISLYSYPTDMTEEAKGTVTGFQAGNFIRDITVEPRVNKEYTFEIKSIVRVKDGNTYATTPDEVITADSTYRIYLTAHARWGYAFKEGDPVYDVNHDVYTHSKITLREETDDYWYFSKDTTYGEIPFSSGETAYISPELIPGDSGKLTGKATSSGDGDATVTIQLIEQGHTEAAYETIVSGGTQSGNNHTATYFFTQIPAGTYTMKVSKANHVTREYTVTVGTAAVTQDVQINLLGDVDFDGVVNANDCTRLFKHVNETDLLTDEYALKCANVNGDSIVNTKDCTRLFKHVNGTEPLW